MSADLQIGHNTVDKIRRGFSAKGMRLAQMQDSAQARISVANGGWGQANAPRPAESVSGLGRAHTKP